MKNSFEFCAHECPYFNDPIACMEGTVCPLKQKKRQYIKKTGEKFGRCIGDCLYAAVVTGNWSVMYLLPILFIINLK